MQLVSREVLFDIMSKKRDVHLVESNDQSMFLDFCEKANAEYAKASSDHLSKSNEMDVFSSAMLSFMKDNIDNIRFVGQGSSRIVFAMANGTALKLAKTKAGIAQNKQEAKICLDPIKKYAIFPDFYGVDKDHWLVLNCELCAKASKNDFKELFKCQPSAIANVIEFIVKMKLLDFQYGQLIDYYKNLENIAYANFVKLLIESKDPAILAIKSLIDFYRENGLDELLLGDLEEISNWGIAIRNGYKILLIIDAGFNEEIHKTYYKEN